jgi:hypothetical protein
LAQQSANTFNRFVVRVDGGDGSLLELMKKLYTIHLAGRAKPILICLRVDDWLDKKETVPSKKLSGS